MNPPQKAQKKKKLLKMTGVVMTGMEFDINVIRCSCCGLVYFEDGILSCPDMPCLRCKAEGYNQEFMGELKVITDR